MMLSVNFAYEVYSHLWRSDVTDDSPLVEQAPSNVKCDCSVKNFPQRIFLKCFSIIIGTNTPMRVNILTHCMIVACFDKLDRFGTPRGTNAPDAIEGFPQ